MAGSTPSPVPRGRLDWLERESARWLADGLIAADARERILAGYTAPSSERRSMLALIVLAVLMCGIGVTLLIGYNWHRLSPTYKVAVIVAAVAASFGGSAAAYRRGRPVVGETLAFAGTLLFGNAIWLIAQVLHIQGHYPDAFFWFGAGALATAFLVRSQWVGLEAAVLFVAWVVAERTAGAAPAYLFLIIWPLLVYCAYRLASPVMLGIAGFGVGVWVFAVVLERWLIAPVAAILAGAALYAAGCWERGDARMRTAWQSAGLIVMLVALIPMMITGAQRELARAATAPGLMPAIVTLVLAAAALSAVVRLRTAGDVAVVATAAAAGAWYLLALAGWRHPVASAILFSILTLGVGVSLIRTALRTGRTFDLASGAIFALAFIILRWVSVVDSLLWSGTLLLATGAGLLLVARLWRTRRPVRPLAQGGLS